MSIKSVINCGTLFTPGMYNKPNKPAEAFHMSRNPKFMHSKLHYLIETHFEQGIKNMVVLAIGYFKKLGPRFE